MEKLLPLEKTRLLSVPMSDPDRGRKALPSAGPHVLSMVIGWSAASGGGSGGGAGLVRSRNVCRRLQNLPFTAGALLRRLAPELTG